MIISFLKFLLKSKNEHSIHSPFVFDLYTRIIKNDTKESIFEDIEKLRKLQLVSKEVIEIQDFGAGSKISNNKYRPIKEIAKNAEKPAKFGRLLYRLISNFKPKTSIDLGTSLGITTLYQAKALESDSTIYTFEGCPETAKQAQNIFNAQNQQNIKLIIGNIDETLPELLQKIESVDFVFFDANHRYEPTLRYFNICYSKANSKTLFIFDDIYWSKEMKQAWAEIKADKRVMLTIDLFFVGLVFFRTNQPKQDFILRF
jgi:predicted O-methyltransferase YrrM